MHGMDSLIGYNIIQNSVKFFANYVKRKPRWGFHSKEKGAKNVYGNVGSVNIKVSAFQDHKNSKEHKRLSWAIQQGEKFMEKHIRAANKCCDEALLTLFKAAYFLGMETIPFNKYSSLCELLVVSKASCTESMYRDENLVVKCYFAYLMSFKNQF